ncbi:14018_t:CDS:2, partial [Acaulospora morrowiae]
MPTDRPDACLEKMNSTLSRHFCITKWRVILHPTFHDPGAEHFLVIYRCHDAIFLFCRIFHAVGEQWTMIPPPDISMPSTFGNVE